MIRAILKKTMMKDVTITMTKGSLLFVVINRRFRQWALL